MANHPDLLATVRAMLADVDAAHTRAISMISTEPSLDAALVAINELATHMRKLSDVDAELRTRIVGQIWNTDNLSLGELAKRIGVSKSRADQLVRNVKKTTAKRTDTGATARRTNVIPHPPR